MRIRKRYLIGFVIIAGALLLGMQKGSPTTTTGVIISNYATLYAFNGDYSYRSNTVHTTVATIHGIDLNQNTPQSILPGGTAYFQKALTNIGNITENVSVNMTTITAGWSAQLIEDSNLDGVLQPGEITPVPSSVALAPTRDYRFFVVMTAPTTFNVVGTVNVIVSGSSTTLGSYVGDNLVTYGGPMRVAETNTASTTVTPSAGGPVITDLMFDGVLVVDRDYIGTTPVIKAKILDPDGVDTASITVIVDGVATTAGITFENGIMTYKITTPLGIGTHTITITAKDIFGNLGTRDFSGRITDKVKIVGEILAYPNPYDPTGGNVKICYQLTVDTGIKIYLHTITGERIWKEEIYAGATGGHAGYNEVIWDGKDGFYDMVANGVYIGHIMSDKGKLLGKVKILVIR